MSQRAEVTPVVPTLYQLRIPSANAHLLNCYIVLDDDAVTLVDTGFADSAPLIREALEQLDRRPSDVARIVLTHFHEDHAGSAAQLVEWSPEATVVAGRHDAAYIRGVEPGPPPTLTDAELRLRPDEGDVSAPPCRVDLEIDDGDVLDVAGEAVVLSVPGHTPGSIALHLPRHDLLVTGDVAAEFHGEVIAGAFHLDRDQVRSSLQKLAATKSRLAVFGHGEPVLQDAAERIARAPDPLG